MNPTLEDQLAAFRYGLIAPIVCRQTPLLPRELKAYMEEVAGQVYDIPGSTRQQISARTLERYLSLYRKGGYDALKPQTKSSKGSTGWILTLLSGCRSSSNAIGGENSAVRIRERRQYIRGFRLTVVEPV